MRITLTIDDALAKKLKTKAFRSRKPFSHVVNDTLRAGLAVGKTARKAKLYRVKPASLGGVAPGVNLDKALALAAALEDDEIIRPGRQACRTTRGRVPRRRALL